MRVSQGCLVSIILQDRTLEMRLPYCLPIDDWSFPTVYNEKQEWTPIRAGQDLGEELESFVDA